MMIEMKERMTCLNSILADREAPFTLEYCQRWKNNCMLEAYQLVNPKKNCRLLLIIFPFRLVLNIAFSASLK